MKIHTGIASAGQSMQEKYGLALHRIHKNVLNIIHSSVGPTENSGNYSFDFVPIISARSSFTYFRIISVTGL